VGAVEELQGNVVGILGVQVQAAFILDDPRVGDTLLVQPHLPSLQLLPVGHTEPEVV
jgi:hypothetical protein